MKTKLKINTATHKAGMIRVDVVKNVVTHTGITLDDWKSLVFEVGCQFVEKHISPYYMQAAFLTNKELGYWNWWLVLFSDHDKDWLELSVKDKTKYLKDKQQMLYLQSTYEEFEYFLKSNRATNASKEI